jgi:hypothetical protein
MALGMVAVVLTCMQGCKEDEETLGTWLTYGTEETGIEDFREFTICPDAFGNVYALQYGPSLIDYRMFYRSKEGKWTEQDVDYIPRDYSNPLDGDRMQTTSDGSVWLLSTESLLRFRFGVLERTYPLTLSEQEDNYMDFEATDSGIWLVHWQYGLCRLDIGTGVMSGYSDPASSGGYAQLSKDGTGNIWIARYTNNYNIIGLMADGSWQRPHDPDSLLVCMGCPPPEWGFQPYFVRFKEAETDPAGNTLFLENSCQYLFRISNGTVQRMAVPSSMPGNTMRADRMGRTWMLKHGSYSHIGLPYLWRYDGAIVAETADLTEAISGNIWPYDLAFDRNNNAWIATNKGVVVYNREGIRF